MALCEAPYAYFCSYNPEVAPLILKVEWSEYTDLMVKGIQQYTVEFYKSLAIIEGVS